jgi:hypothetical protein
VVHPHEDADELLLDRLQLTEGERRVAKLSLVDPLPRDVLDELAELLRRGVGEHARRRLDAVGEHHHRRLRGLGDGPRVRELAALGGAPPPRSFAFSRKYEIRPVPWCSV